MSYSELTVVTLGLQYDRVCLDVLVAKADACEVIGGNSVVGVFLAEVSVVDDDAVEGASPGVSFCDLAWSIM